MKLFLVSFLLFLVSSHLTYANYVLSSPDNSLQLNVSSSGRNFSLAIGGLVFVKNAEIDLAFNNESVFTTSKIKKIKRSSEKKQIQQYVAYKNSVINSESNTMILEFRNGNSIEYILFNDGFAYRYITADKRIVEVNEKIQLEFEDNYKMWTSPTELNNFYSTFEVPYEEVKIADFTAQTQTYLPLLLENKKKNKMLITDVNVFDYPNTFFKKSSIKKNTLEAVFPPYPLETQLIGDRRSSISKSADYIAKTAGKRSFPWRLFILTENDAELLSSNLSYILAEDKRIDDISWIKPGRVAWDWWNSVNLKGVDFESGFNTETYKYYIDFAARNGLEYVILDEGWSVSTQDISQPRSDLDLFELIRYANSQKVDLILWASWRAIEDQFFVIEQYSKWGIKGIKVDFMDRADQWMVNFYERVATEAAKHKLLVNFHGSYKPTGLQRTFPNVINFEGVCGLEHAKWSKRITPKHNLTLPFIRMVSGPMDYTPGAMRNYHEEEYYKNFHRPGSMTTRAHEVATFVVFEGPLQMLADAPTNYEKEQETTNFISLIPSTWDELRVLHAEIGSCLVLARRKGNKWYIAGLNNNDMQRTIMLDLSFINRDDIKVNVFCDGINSHRHAEDYKVSNRKIKTNTPFEINMSVGGGFVIMEL